jgi:hypothetical protein
MRRVLAEADAGICEAADTLVRTTLALTQPPLPHRHDNPELIDCNTNACAYLELVFTQLCTMSNNGAFRF